jgi:hypothetical protein
MLFRGGAAEEEANRKAEEEEARKKATEDEAKKKASGSRRTPPRGPNSRAGMTALAPFVGRSRNPLSKSTTWTSPSESIPIVESKRPYTKKS